MLSPAGGKAAYTRAHLLFKSIWSEFWGVYQGLRLSEPHLAVKILANLSVNKPAELGHGKSSRCKKPEAERGAGGLTPVEQKSTLESQHAAEGRYSEQWPFRASLEWMVDMESNADDRE